MKPTWGLVAKLRRVQFTTRHLFAYTTAAAMVVYFFTLPLNWRGFFAFWPLLWNGDVWRWFVEGLR